MQTLTRTTLLFAVLAVLCVGCARTTKIDLNGLSNARDASGGAQEKDLVIEDGTAVLPEPGGDWTDSQKGIDADVANFIKNGQYWKDKVYFEYNRYELRPTERPKVEDLANYLNSDKALKVIIEGHCDERGSDEYNRALAERRSLAVKTYLVGLGIDAARIQTISYGEDKPEIIGAKNEQEHKQNRRAQFLVGK